MNPFNVAAGGITSIGHLVQIFNSCAELVEYLKNENKVWLEIYNEFADLSKFLTGAKSVYSTLHKQNRLPENEDGEWEKLAQRGQTLGEELQSFHTKWKKVRSKSEFRFEVTLKSAMFYFSKKSPIEQLIAQLQNIKLTLLLRQQLLTNHLCGYDNNYVIQQLRVLDKKLSGPEPTTFDDEPSTHEGRTSISKITHSESDMHRSQSENKSLLSNTASNKDKHRARKILKRMSPRATLKEFQNRFQKTAQGLTPRSSKSSSSLAISIQSHESGVGSEDFNEPFVSFSVSEQRLEDFLNAIPPSPPNNFLSATITEELPIGACDLEINGKSDMENNTNPHQSLANSKGFITVRHLELDDTTRTNKEESATTCGGQTELYFQTSTNYKPPSVEDAEEIDHLSSTSMDGIPWLLHPLETMEHVDDRIGDPETNSVITERLHTQSSFQCSLQGSINRRVFYGCSCKYGIYNLESHRKNSTLATNDDCISAYEHEKPSNDGRKTNNQPPQLPQGSPSKQRNWRDIIGEGANYLIQKHADKIGKAVENFIKGEPIISMKSINNFFGNTST